MTLTGIRTTLARAGLVTALMNALGGTIPAAVVAQQPGATTAVAIPATWDSLYSDHDFFALRDALMTSPAQPSPQARFYRGMVAHAFNDNDGAIAALAPLIDSLPAGLSSSHLADAADALGDSYRRISRYRESASAYRTALRSAQPQLDSATRVAFQAWAAVGEALSSTPPLRVRWKSAASNFPVENDSVMFAVVATVNGDTLRAPLGIDAAAPFTIIDSATAVADAVQMLNTTVTANVAGNTVSARIGLIATLGVGNAVISNVPVLVVPRTALTLGLDRGRVSGMLGFPVLASLGSITFSHDGQLALSSPGSDNDTSRVSNMAITARAAVVNARYNDRPVSLLLDPGAHGTLMYPSFLRAFPATTSGAALATYVGNGEDGIVSLPSYVLPSLSLVVGGRTVKIGPVNALMRDPGSLSQFYMGALGRDALATANRVTLDFGAMTLRFRDAPQASVLPRIVYPTEATGTTRISRVPGDIAFVILLFALFVVPKALQRYRLPSAITSLLMGAGATAFGLFHNDPTLHLLSTFGIVALFLFAGLEIDGHELRRQLSPLIIHGVVWSVVLACGALILTRGFGFAARPSVLIALALLTPSTGFILSSLSGFGLTDSERFSVKTYVIGSELLALTVLFFVLQSTSIGRLAFAVAAMIGVVTIIPFMFRLFARIVAPHAPRSEFAFLLMVAVVCAYATTRLGVYYLVGAFLVGIAAQRFRSELPAMSSERMVDALESFGSVFIPFYFFHAGTEIVREQITLRAVAIGVTLVVLLIPIRVGITMLQRRFLVKDPVPVARRIGVALIPTLVFTLVIVDILNTNFGMHPYMLGALVLYTVMNTSIPAFVLHSSPPEFENVGVADLIG